MELAREEKENKTSSLREVKKSATGAKRKAPVDGESEKPSKRLKTDLKSGKKGEAASPLKPCKTKCSSTLKAVAGVKRSAYPNDDEESGRKRQKPDSKSGEEEGAVKAVKKIKKLVKLKVKRVLRGLSNHQNSCFFNANVHLFDKAFENHDMDKILGETDPEIENFGLDQKVCDRFNMNKYKTPGDKGRKLRKVEKEARNAIKAAAKAGKTKQVSLARHFRNFLNSKRSNVVPRKRFGEEISPYLLQSVLAFGEIPDDDHAKSGATRRETFSGDTQQDALETFQTTLHALCADPHVRDEAAVRKLFEVKKNIRDACRNESCGYLATPVEQAVENFHELVPSSEGHDKLSLKTIFSESKSSSKDSKCPDCSAETIYASSEIVECGDNLVLRVNRNRWDRSKGRPIKVMAKINFDMPVIDGPDGSQYDLSVIVCHKGSSLEAGHYTALRKHSGDWYLMNDSKCTKVGPEETPGDSDKVGQSCLLLYTKRKA